MTNMAKVSNNWQNKLKDFAIMNMILLGSQKILGMENGKETRATNLIVHEQQIEEVTYENLLPGGSNCKWDCNSYCTNPTKNGWFWTTIIGGGAVVLAGIGVGIYFLVDHLNKKDEPINKEPFCNDLFSKCPFKNLTESLNSTLNYYNLTNGKDFCFGDMYPIEDKYGFIFNDNSNCTLYTNTLAVSDEGSIFTEKEIESVDLLQLPKDCSSTSFMFAGVDGLKSVNLKDINTEKLVNTSAMFIDNPSLNNINGLDKLNFDKVIDSRGMFALTNLTTIDLKGFNNGNVKFADFMFACNPSLKTIKNLLFIGTGSLESAAEMFAITGINNTAIKEVEKWNTSNLIDVESIFAYLFNVKNINLTNWDTDKIKNAESMFEGSRLDNITLKDFNSLENANSMFKDANIGLIIGLENLKLKNLEFVKSMFSGFSGQSTINLTNLNTSKIKSAEEMFRDVELNKLVLRRFDNLEDAKAMFKNANISDFDLVNITLKNLINAESMFEEFKGIQDIDLSTFNTSKLISTFRMFKNAKIKNYILSGLASKNLTNMSEMFTGSLAEFINLDKWETNSSLITKDAFKNCDNLNEVDLSLENNPNIKSELENSTYECTEGEEIDKCEKTESPEEEQQEEEKQQEEEEQEQESDSVTVENLITEDNVENNNYSMLSNLNYYVTKPISKLFNVFNIFKK